MLTPHDVAPTPSPPPTEARPFVCHLNARSIHLRFQQRLSPCPLGNNLVSLDLLGSNSKRSSGSFFPIVLSLYLSIVPSVHRPKKSRAFEKGVCMHTGGSINLQDHVIRLSEELGQSVYVDDVFQQTHLRKDTGQFVNDRSRQTHEEFEARLSQARSDTTSSVGESQLTPLDPTEEQRLRSRCWVATAGPKCKGHLYGTGDLAHAFKCENENFMQHIQGFSSGAKDVAEIN
ncbi:hypothetical protein HKD37_03G007159 [Glycine soja]